MLLECAVPLVAVFASISWPVALVISVCAISIAAIIVAAFWPAG